MKRPSPRVLWFLVVAAALVLLSAATGDGTVQPSTLGGIALAAGFSIIRYRLLGARERRFWSTVWELRRANATERQEKLAAIADVKTRKRIAKILAADGEESVDGDVERFPYPLGLSRFYTRRYWVSWMFAAVLLVASMMAGDVRVRVATIAIALFFMWNAWRSSAREKAMQSVIEITPFRITETFPDGSSKTILLNWSLRLQLDDRKRCAILTPASTDDGIVIDYRRLGFHRLLELVIEYGGFKRHADEPTA